MIMDKQLILVKRQGVKQYVLVHAKDADDARQQTKARLGDRVDVIPLNEPGATVTIDITMPDIVVDITL